MKNNFWGKIMKNIMFGFLFVILNFNLTFNNDIILNVLPNFVGYWFLLKGLNELRPHSTLFEKAMPYAKVLFFYYILDFVANITGIASKLLKQYVLWGFGFGLVLIIISLFCSQLIMKGIMEMEAKFQCKAGAEKLYRAWNSYAIGLVISFFLVYFLPGLSVIGLLVSLIINIYFLITLNKTKNEFTAVSIY
jgi:hypothetical protein